MPYEVVKRGDKWLVQKPDGKSFGEHDSKAEAERQLEALYANEGRGAMRVLHLVGATSGARTEWLGDREYLVVPTVALIGDNVIHAVNAPEAEFVPARILSAEGWERKPLMLGHPTKNGRQISANDPDVLRASSFGFTSNPVLNGKRLGVESWCDVKKLEALGQSQLLADLRAGKPVEVSTGSFVETRPASGTMNGKRYATEWASIGPDHLAFLPGGVGACSVAMGCGAHRAAMRVMEGSDELRDASNPEGINQYTHGGGGGKGGSDRASHLEKTLGLSAADAKKFANYETMHGTQKMLDAVKVQKQKEWRSSPAKEAALKLKSKASQKYFRGHSMNISHLKARILALFDSPEAAAAEEAAELVAYNSMRTLFDGVGAKWDEASGLIDELIADEENPTQTRQQEEAEEEVEDARLDALRMLCYAMIAELQSVCNACTEQQMPEPMEPSDPRYMEAFRAAVGKEISAKNLKVIQAAHDSSHDVHGQTVALGAQCEGMKAMAAKDCPECEGTGQITKDGKQMDCPACDGEGTMRSAEDGGSSAEGGQMTKEQRAAEIKKLVECPCSGFSAEDVKVLEAADDAAIERFRAAADARKKEIDDLKAAQAKTEADLKAAQAAQIPAEELTQLRALADERKAKDAAEKADLVKKLEPLKTLSKEQLEAKSLEDLRTLAAFAKVPAADFSAKGVPVPRTAAQTEGYAPPDPYDLKALQGKKEAVN